jgi:hypothetical protein
MFRDDIEAWSRQNSFQFKRMDTSGELRVEGVEYDNKSIN